MYNWLFFKVYGYYKSKDNDDPLFNSIGPVFFAQVVHVSLIVLVFSKIFHFEIPVLSTNSSINKILLLPLMGLWLVFISKFYKNKVKNRKLNNDVKPINLYQLLLIVFVVIFIPLYIGIKLSGGQIWR